MPIPHAWQNADKYTKQAYLRRQDEIYFHNMHVKRAEQAQRRVEQAETEIERLRAELEELRANQKT